MLTNVNHGKLINFRTSSVEYRFVSTTLDIHSRGDYNINLETFDNNKKSILLVDIIRDLLKDWGAFLDLNLYHEAVIYFLGGKEKVMTPIDIVRDSRVIGQQAVCKLDERIAFHFSALTKNFKSYERNIKRLLSHTKLDSIEWVNFDKRNIEFKTIK